MAEWFEFIRSQSILSTVHVFGESTAVHPLNAKLTMICPRLLVNRLFQVSTVVKESVHDQTTFSLKYRVPF